MQERISNHVKALLVAEDFSEVARVSQSNCLTVQHFDYRCSRSRNESGMPYGPTVSVIIQFSFKSLSNNKGKIFYDRLKSQSPFPYTFVFNATFDSVQQLSRYDDAMIVSGYIVDIEESFDKAAAPGETVEQMLTNVKMLLCSITYVGKDSNKTLSLIH